MITTDTRLAPHIPALERQRYRQLQQQLNDNPEQAELWLRLGQCCRGLGYLQEAATAFERAEQNGISQNYCCLMASILRQSYQHTTNTAGFQPVPYLLHDEFLSAAEQQRVWQIYQHKQSQLHESRVGHNMLNKQIRSSHAINLRSLDAADFFKQRIQGVLAPAYSYFSIPQPTKPQLALELTSHTDQGFYDVHSDVDPNNPHRRLSYIYYFHQQPRAFEGGQLHLYDTHLAKQEYNNKFTCIEPRHNRLVIFPSHFYHQVCKVSLPESNAIQGRHSLNGWHSELA